MTEIAAGLLFMAIATDAAAQPKDALKDISAKTTFSDAERQAIRDRVAELRNGLNNKTDSKARTTARQDLVKDLNRGTPQFRAVGATIAGEMLQPLFGQRELGPAHEAVLALVELDHEATREALEQAMKAPLSPVRYQAARGLRLLQPRLKRTDDFRSVLIALGDAGEREREPQAVRAIYLAMDFSKQADFTAHDVVALNLARVFAGRLNGAGAIHFNPASDVQGFEVALRLAPKLRQPPPALVGGLARFLASFWTVATSDAASVQPEVVEACETALYQLVEKRTPLPAGLPRLTELLRANAKPAEIEAARTKWKRTLIGVSGTDGLLNRKPWELPRGLEGP